MRNDTLTHEKNMLIRPYQTSDCQASAALFYDTVHKINAKDYTKEQLDAWAGTQIDLDQWDRSLRAHYCVVMDSGGIITGFGDIDPSGYLDRLFVHADYQNRGIATALCSKLEGAVDASILTVHASITAKPFFEGRGYRMVREQRIMRKGVLLTNYLMEKKR